MSPLLVTFLIFASSSQLSSTSVSINTTLEIQSTTLFSLKNGTDYEETTTSKENDETGSEVNTPSGYVGNKTTNTTDREIMGYGQQETFNLEESGSYNKKVEVEHDKEDNSNNKTETDYDGYSDDNGNYSDDNSNYSDDNGNYSYDYGNYSDDSGSYSDDDGNHSDDNVDDSCNSENISGHSGEGSAAGTGGGSGISGNDSVAIDDNSNDTDSASVDYADEKKHEVNGSLVDDFKEPRIVGGDRTTINEFPHQVAIYTRHEGFICGGSIISSRFVLTAAHCLLSPAPLPGDLILAGSTERNSGNRYSPVAYYSHRNFNPTTMNFDAGIIKVQPRIKFSAKCKAIKIVPLSVDVPESTELWISGWGRLYEDEAGLPTNYLYKASVKTINLRKCSNMLDRGGSHLPITSNMICAGGDYPYKDACQGDSGGPLTLRKKKQSFLVGIVSWGIGCARPQMPGVYTDLRSSAIRGFIERFTGLILDRQMLSNTLLLFENENSKETKTNNHGNHTLPYATFMQSFIV